MRTNINIQNSNEDNLTCPITLNTQANINKENRTCFKIQRNGKTQQIYNAQALIDWLSLHPEYPHKEKPTNAEIAKLQQIFPNFIPFSETVYNIFRSAQTVTQFSSLMNNNIIKELYEILKKAYSLSSIQDLEVWYKKNWRKLSKRSFWRSTDPLSRIESIYLKDIFVGEFDITLYLKVDVLINGKTEYHSIIHMVSISDMGSVYGIWYSEKAVEQEISQRLDISDIHIYHSDNGEQLYKKNDSNSFIITAPPTQGGGKSIKKYKGRNYIIRTGSKGGKFILVKGVKIYTSK